MDQSFLIDVQAGLTAKPKWLYPKYFYDEQGSILFDQICEQPEYYVPERETEILERVASKIAQEVGPNPVIIEYGAGASKKIRSLLGAFEEIGLYLPIDISEEFLESSAAKLQEYFPRLPIETLAADYTQIEHLRPDVFEKGENHLLFFPGSTIGNLRREKAKELLKKMHSIVEGEGYLLIGTDLPKDKEVLERAYNDAAGVTAAFNVNILTRINRELEGNFDESKFVHEAHFNQEESRIEMHLRSVEDQTVSIANQTFDFKKGESIHTESSYKYSLDAFEEMARGAGFEREAVWTDDDEYFAVQLFRCKST